MSVPTYCLVAVFQFALLFVVGLATSISIFDRSCKGKPKIQMDLLTAPCWKPGTLRDVKSNHKCERPRIIQHQKTVSFYHFSGSNTETTSLIAFCRHILAISRRTNCPRTNHPFPTPSIYSLLASLDWFKVLSVSELHLMLVLPRKYLLQKSAMNQSKTIMLFTRVLIFRSVQYLG